jgi:hypothetical protein
VTSYLNVSIRVDRCSCSTSVPPCIHASREQKLLTSATCVHGPNASKLRCIVLRCRIAPTCDVISGAEQSSWLLHCVEMPDRSNLQCCDTIHGGNGKRMPAIGHIHAGLKSVINHELCRYTDDVTSHTHAGFKPVGVRSKDMGWSSKDMGWSSKLQLKPEHPYIVTPRPLP